MATKQRKDKRLQERLRTGDSAVAQLVPLRTQVTAGLAEIDRLQKTDVAHQELIECQRKTAQALDTITTQQVNAQERIRALITDKAELRQQCDALQVTVEHLQKENIKLNAFDRDSAKLRRRLRETKEQLNARNSEVSRLKKELTGF